MTTASPQARQDPRPRRTPSPRRIRGVPGSPGIQRRRRRHPAAAPHRERPHLAQPAPHSRLGVSGDDGEGARARAQPLCLRPVLACSGNLHGWRDPGPPGAAIFRHSNAAAATAADAVPYAADAAAAAAATAAAQAGRRQSAVRMRRGGAQRKRARARTHVSAAGLRAVAAGRRHIEKGGRERSIPALCLE